MKLRKYTLTIKITVICLVMAIMCSWLLSTVAYASESTQSSENEIYYSDLFYGYDTSYLSNAYIEDYYDDVDDVARDIFNDYINSPRYFWTQIKTSIAAVVSSREFFELMSDTYGGTNFNYTDAIDSANILFAKELVGENDSMKMMGDVEKLTQKARKIVNICNDFEKIYNAEETHEVIIEKFFDTLYNSDIFDAQGKTSLISIKTQFIAEAEAAGLFLSSSKELISYLKAISVGLMLEELRLEMLDDIIENSDGYQTVYTGMSRLRSQLDQGFASYVVKTYMQDKVVDAIFDAMQDAILGQVSAYGFVSAVLKTASWVLFDVLFDIPNMDDMLVQMVLNEYVDGFHFILNSKVSSFKLQFDSDDILEYESLVEGFDASCKALLKASEKLTLSSNYSNLVTVKNRHKGFSYDNYIKVVKDIISATPIEERKVKNYTTWSITSKTSIVRASDIIENEKLYLFNNAINSSLIVDNVVVIEAPEGIIKGDVTVDNRGYITVSSGSSYTIYGSLEIDGNDSYVGTLEIEEGATLIVTDTIIIGKYSDALIYNNGTLICLEDVSLNKYYRGYGRIKQELDTAQIIFYGDISVASEYCCDITGGTVIIVGEREQQITDLVAQTIIFEGTEKITASITAHNVDVTNASGLSGSIYLYGHFDLHGSPFDGTIYMYDGATFADGSNYNKVIVSDEVTTLCSNITAETIEVNYDSNLIVPLGGSYIIAGNLTIEGNSIYDGGPATFVKVEEGAMLTINGDTSIAVDWGEGEIINAGRLVFLGDVSVGIYSDIIMEEDATNAETVFYGDVCITYRENRNYYSPIKAGKVIFAGEQVQNITGLKAYNVIFKGTEVPVISGLSAYNIDVYNSNGITGNISLYGHFDLHGNSFDGTVYMYDGATFADGSNYNKVIVSDEVTTLRSNITAETIEVNYDSNLIVPPGSSYIIAGNLTIDGNGIYNGVPATFVKVEEGATLTINGDTSIAVDWGEGEIINAGKLVFLGDVNVGAYSAITNNGTVIVNGDFNGTVIQTLETAEMHFRENVVIGYNSSVTEGTFIFDGTETQKVYVYNAYNVEVLNPEGIQYLSDINVYGNFDAHQNPVDMGSYKINFYDEGGFGTLPENQSDWIISVQPTYTTVGERYKECLVCGEKIYREEIPILVEPDLNNCEHSFGEWNVVNFPTCTNNGIDTRKCVLCDYTEERVTDALNHDKVQHSAQSATCTENGWNAYESCLRCGYTTYDEIPANGHTYGEWNQTIAPGNGSKGEEQRNCEKCDYYEIREVAALGYLQAFIDAVTSLSKDQSTEATYNELYAALQLYAELTDAEKTEASEEFLIVQAAIKAYNSKVENANTELKNATEIAFIPISASFTFLAALWLLLKKKFWVK